MTNAVFPDNTVLCNFAAVGKTDLLGRILRGNGRWTEAVEFEARRSASYESDLKRLIASGEMGEPIEITNPADIEQIERVRRAVFGGTASQPLRHLGEAQTCHVLKQWPEFAGSWWISDDREALRYARFQGLATRETIDLIAMGVADGELTANGGFVLLEAMAEAGRSLRLPSGPHEL